MSMSGFNPSSLGGSNSGGGLSSFLSGLFGNSSSPYEAAQGPYNQYMAKAANAQNPFLQAGQGAIGNYQNWLGGMQDPSKFINNLMGQYQESPWAKYEQQQGIRSGQNAASASGLSGSTPFAQQLQQNASNISSQDMNQWLQNVLGVNTQYGSGEQNLMNNGANAANNLSNIYGNQAQGLGNLAYGQQMGQNQDMSNMFAGGMQMFTHGLFS